MSDQTRILTYDGRTGRVTSQTVPSLPGDAEQSILPDEEEQLDPSDPFYMTARLETAIVRHVTGKVQQARERS